MNPLSHPVLPTSIKTPEEQQQHLLPPLIKSDYSRLTKGNPEGQSFHITSLLSHPIPTYRSFLPILSFVTQNYFYDIPLPLLPDYVLSFRESLPSIFLSFIVY